MDRDELLRECHEAIVDAQNKGGLSGPMTAWIASLPHAIDAHLHAAPQPYNTTSDERLMNTNSTTTSSLNVVHGKAASAAPLFDKSFGYCLAMAVMQSPTYARLDDRERAECDELIARGMKGAAPISETAAELEVDAAERFARDCEGYVPSQPKAAGLPPEAQMVLGDHSIGIFKDGKLLAADADVYQPPAAPDAGLSKPTGPAWDAKPCPFCSGREGGEVNTWPGGKRRALTQSEHEDWNAHNYPGTRQLCATCGEPTGRCEDDSLFDDDDCIICEACWEVSQFIRYEP